MDRPGEVQTTYLTNDSPRNRQYRGRVDAWLGERAGRCRVEPRNVSYRCVQAICDFADRLFPHMERTISANGTTTDHDGIFRIKSHEVTGYMEKYNPKILRWGRRKDTQGFAAMNFGQSKGQTFERVLIYPTRPMKEYLNHGNPASSRTGTSSTSRSPGQGRASPSWSDMPAGRPPTRSVS